VVEGTGLENRRTGNGIESSNLSLSVQVPTRWPSGPRVVRWGNAFYSQTVSGRVAEWFKAHAWKVCVR
jgi:hypothetical protein